MAHGDVAVVCAEQHLLAACDRVAVLIYPGVHRRLCAALADGLYLRYRVRKLKEPPAAREEVGQEIRAKPEAHYGDIENIYYIAELIYLLRLKELALVRDYDVDLACIFKHCEDIITLLMDCAGLEMPILDLTVSSP